MSREYVTALKESLEKKVKILEETRRICIQQTEILEREPMDFEAFDRLVDDKDICIEKLDKLDEGFELVYARVSEELQGKRAEYADLIEQMQKLISRITDEATAIRALEEKNKHIMEGVFTRERRDLAESKRSVSVATQYYRNMTGVAVESSQFMDQKK